ncbi:MAG: 16S rRNA (cytosine(1402)-N(4))-methyltransferase RsmH [bacterium]
MDKQIEKPVLLKQVLNFFNPQSNQNFVDCTLGQAGHALALLKYIKPKGKVLGIDFKILVKPRPRLILAQDNFANLKEIVNKYNFKNISGILFDLGLSDWHLKKSSRGFSFQKNESLDMRMSDNGATAQEILNQWPEQELEKIFRLYGEEKQSKSIAMAIVKNRPIQTTADLSKLIYSWKSRAKIFQALRIVINRELENLGKALPQAMDLAPKVAVISFHSLEDRIVKNYFKTKIFSQDQCAKLRIWEK